MSRILLTLCLSLVFVSTLAADDLAVTLRSRVADANSKNQFNVKVQKETWKPQQTAIIVCDMWDSHHCPKAVKRVVEIAPRMNQVLEKARQMGVLIIHAPSSCMKPYENHPGRKLAQNAPPAKTLPKDISRWCYKIDTESAVPYPIDQTDGGCDCSDVEQQAWDVKLKVIGRNPKAPWLKQIETLKIAKGDAISDSGIEIWNLLSDRKIDNVILLGVHTNMCVLGRPFGLRQMAKNGKNVVLMRDMTDTMYNPKRKPFVSHFEGTRLIIEYIEKTVCPTITSDQIIGGEPFRFAGAKKK